MSYDECMDWSRAVWDAAIEAETGEGLLFLASWYWALAR